MLLCAIFSLSLTTRTSNSNSQRSQCRCYPSDPCWPSTHEFAAFNQSLGGRLISTVPLASACHDDQFTPYNATKCKALQGGWLKPETQYAPNMAPPLLFRWLIRASYGDPASVMAPFFANRSCDPFLPRFDRCIVGTCNTYSVNVSKPAHISKAIQFATAHNIRLTIRNTRHE